MLNIKNLPYQHKPISLKLFIHEPNTIPDVLDLESHHIELNREALTKIGVSILKNDETRNFQDMPFEKRKCLLKRERKSLVSDY